MSKKFCTSCGAQLALGTKFCPKCGAGSGEGEAQSSVAPQPSVGEPTAPSPTPCSIPQTTNVEPEGSDEKGCLGSLGSMVSGAVGCGCAAILLIGGIIALILGLLA